MVEVIYNLERDWRQVFDDLRLVVYITFEPVEYQGRGRTTCYNVFVIIS